MQPGIVLGGEAGRLHRLLDLSLGVAGAEVDIGQCTAQATRIAARLLGQGCQRASNGEPTVVHGRVDEEVIDLLQLVDTLVELDVGEDAAGHHEVAKTGPLQPVTHEGSADLLQDELDAGRQMGAVEVGRQPLGQQTKRRAVIHGHRVPDPTGWIMRDELTQDVRVGGLAERGQPRDLSLVLFRLEPAELGGVGVEVA